MSKIHNIRGETIHKKIKAILTIFLVFAVLTLPAFAEEEDEDEKDLDGDSSHVNSSKDVEFSDFWHPNEAKAEVDNSEFSEPITKFSNWGTYALILVIVCYFGYMAILMFSGNPQKQSQGFLGIVIGILAVVFFTCGTSTAFDFLN